MQPFSIVSVSGPVIATAIHAGHGVRPDIQASLALAEEDRLREEDPATDRLIQIGSTTVAVNTSRFQVDLNRPRERAVYLHPDDAWGLGVWNGQLTEESIARSLAEYDAFYSAMKHLIDGTIAIEGHCVVLDVHSYNHRRSGPVGLPGPSPDNPEVNIGTESVDRVVWAGVVRALSESMLCAGFDVRENVKFSGGQLSHWVNESFPHRACAIAIEFKKTFMDEWSGEIDEIALERRRGALSDAAGAVVCALSDVTP